MLLLFGRCLLDPTGNQSFPCLPKLPCQNIMLPLPNEGDEVDLKREKVEEKKGESTSLYSQSLPPTTSVLLSKDRVALVMGGGKHYCKSELIHCGSAASVTRVYNPWTSPGLLPFIP